MCNTRNIIRRNARIIANYQSVDSEFFVWFGCSPVFDVFRDARTELCLYVTYSKSGRIFLVHRQNLIFGISLQFLFRPPHTNLMRMCCGKDYNLYGFFFPLVRVCVCWSVCFMCLLSSVIVPSFFSVVKSTGRKSDHCEFSYTCTNWSIFRRTALAHLHP